MTDRLAILLSTDEGFAYPTAVAATSAARHVPEPILPVVTIVEDSLEEQTKARLKRCIERCNPRAEVRFLPLPSEARYDPNTARLPQATTGRHFGADTLAKEFDRVLYMDGDVVVEKDLGVLPSLDLGTRPVYAVPDSLFVTRGERCEALGMPTGEGAERPYVNSGVLLINSRYWLETEIAQRALAVMMEHKSVFTFPDQDSLNVVGEEAIGILDGSWNLQAPYRKRAFEEKVREITPDLETPDRTGMIFHYIGFSKPWKWKARHPTGRIPWLKAYVQSGWHPWPVAVVRALSLYVFRFLIWPIVELRYRMRR